MQDVCPLLYYTYKRAVKLSTLFIITYYEILGNF